MWSKVGLVVPSSLQSIYIIIESEEEAHAATVRGPIHHTADAMCFVAFTSTNTCAGLLT